MDQIEQQLETIRTQQTELAFNAGDDRADPEVENPLSFALEVHSDWSEGTLRDALRRAFPDIAFTLERLFNDNLEDTHFYYFELVATSFHDLEGSEFTLVHHLLKVPGVVSVDADQETDYYPWQPVTIDSDIAMSASKSSCFVDANDADVPSHQGWALLSTKVDKAWAKFGVTGRGIRLAQIDTGLAEHVEFDGRVIDDTLGINIYKPGRGAVDPLKKRKFGFDQPGHGTAVASVIISQGGLDDVSSSEPGVITGVAQGVDFLPIRAIRSVIRIKQAKVAKAIDMAVQNGAHIISMSLGGVGTGALKRALRRAEAANVIVMAASGNCVKTVVWPARYEQCIAVSGVTHKGHQWRGASVGESVDFSAPAEFVHHAVRNKPNQKKDGIRPGQGTSFAVALSAGIAALWLEHFGREALIANLAPGESLMQRFRTMAKRTATPGPDWQNHKLGEGIINAEKLLETNPFIDPISFSALSVMRPESSKADDLSNTDLLRELLSEQSHDQPMTDFDEIDEELLDVCGQEIIHRMLQMSTLSRGAKLDYPPPTDALAYLQDKYPVVSDLITQEEGEAK